MEQSKSWKIIFPPQHSSRDRGYRGGGGRWIKIDYNGETCVRFHVIMKYKTFPNYIHNSAIKAPHRVRVSVDPVRSVRGAGTMLLCKHSLSSLPASLPSLRCLSVKIAKEMVSVHLCFSKINQIFIDENAFNIWYQRSFVGCNFIILVIQPP